MRAGDAGGGRGRGRGGARRAAGRRRAGDVLARGARVRGAPAPRPGREAVQLRAPAEEPAHLMHSYRDKVRLITLSLTGQHITG